VGIVMIKCPKTGREIPTGIKRIGRGFDAVQCSSRAPTANLPSNHEWYAKERLGLRAGLCSGDDVLRDYTRALRSARSREK